MRTTSWKGYSAHRIFDVILEESLRTYLHGECFSSSSERSGRATSIPRGVPFRWWGNKLSQHERYRIVSRAAEVRGFASWAYGARRLAPPEHLPG